MLPISLLSFCLLAILPNIPASSAADDKKPLKPCTIRSPTSNAFFDLNSIHISPPVKKDGKDKDKDKDEKGRIGRRAKDAKEVESWHARGYDYGANFTINFCGPVVEELEDVEGLKRRERETVGAFYERGGRTYSIGANNSEPVFRGRKLVLNYTDGSPCPRRPRTIYNDKDKDKRKSHDDDDDDGDDRAPIRRKHTIISLLCERDPLAPKAALSFVGTVDECSYFFEARSSAACGGIEVSHGQGVRLGGVFLGIGVVAMLVYLVGGCVYQRNVMNQRGWRQLPNYALWAGIGSFIRDMAIILFSSCSRFMPNRRGYNRLSQSGGYGGSRGRGRDSEDENRLIDQLDEEWED